MKPSQGPTIDASTDQLIHDVLAAGLTLLLIGFGVRGVLRLLQRSRPGLAIGVPVALAVALRIFAAAGVSLTPLAPGLRGGDEVLFAQQSAAIAHSSLASSEWASALTGKLYEFVIAVQARLLDSPDFALRLTEIGIAVLGLALLATAVYDLVGGRAAVIAAWMLAAEPSGIFFSSLLHKESNMFLAEGLVAFGGARMWKRGDLASLPILALGCLIAVATRPYAGWFLIAAAAAITLHAGLRATRRGEVSSLGLIAVVVLLGAISAPVVWQASSHQNLEQTVQASQDSNASDSANLSLEKVDFSTRGAVITNLPVRAWDITFKPYLWQLGSPSQRLGAIGGLVTLVVLALLGSALVRRRGEIFARAGPLVYLLAFLLAAYSLSTGNAGTGFRYRSHLLAVALCLLAAVRIWRAEREVASVPRALPDALPAARGYARS